MGKCKYLCPDRLVKGETWAGSNQPTVAQLSLYQVMTTHTFSEQMRLRTDLLPQQAQRTLHYYNYNDTNSMTTSPMAMTMTTTTAATTTNMHIHSWLVGWARFHSTQFRSFRRRCFYRSDDPTKCRSTEGGWLVIQIALNLTRLISPCYNNTTYMHIQDNDTQRNLSTVSAPSEIKQNLVD